MFKNTQIYKKITTYLSKTLILHGLKQKNMLTFTSQKSFQLYLSQQKTKNQTLGFVPTMGAIHNGHLSLMKQALSENDWVVVSIFVNPTQFNNPEDLKKYPRTLERDQALIEQLDSRIILFAPTTQDLYGTETVAKKFDYDGLENQMEGLNRPGHFDGVGTIVKKLFEIVQPDRAYFGEKDFQQLQIVKKMVTKEQLPVEVIGCPIFRESSGLAMSSRNELLSTEAKHQAAFIYATLLQAQAKFKVSSIAEVMHYVQEAFAQKPEFDLEYFEIANEATLEKANEKAPDQKYRGFIVAHIDNVRLIDTILLN